MDPTLLSLLDSIPQKTTSLQTRNSPRTYPPAPQRLPRRVAAVAAMFLGAALGAISAALWLATAISAMCCAALCRPVRTSDKV